MDEYQKCVELLKLHLLFVCCCSVLCQLSLSLELERERQDPPVNRAMDLDTRSTRRSFRTYGTIRWEFSHHSLFVEYAMITRLYAQQSYQGRGWVSARNSESMPDFFNTTLYAKILVNMAQDVQVVRRNEFISTLPPSRNCRN